MHIIKRGALVSFWQEHPDARPSLESWYTVVRRASWENLAERKPVYRTADLIGRRTVFNIAGNKYRLGRKTPGRKSSRAEIKGVNVMSCAFLTLSDFPEVSRAGR